MSELTFKCCLCGEEFTPEFLSVESIEDAGVRSAVTAIRLEPSECVCVYCENLIEPDEDADFGRTDAETWEFSGVNLDPGMQVFYQLNY
jgi:hypothetical protein